ncbi:GNAT family N-acetyltransferase [Mesorhizobium sp. M7A.F.Ca.US.006.01.1.1]|uniref:GNAT family N-acetyltransferase n=1 Tax=Mesorhizobium sp. M7A.F.Ca.US.006.01.1.1 TaxID=2496707 RepID=UPI000FCABD6E|nr:GNAT family N-acetyltransferase [Mesorhizobium sp. M7A.F.Ca.US.006.01.1.1]RUZ78308.1 GNAT family N-acetyltransferase [Mesorhizobium sp. M7A.F.Ca.US.006.01.1.1]
MLEIRPAQEADRSAIVQLWHQGWHDAHAHLVPAEILAYRTPAHFSLWLEQSTDAFHVAVGDGLLGFVSINGVELVKLYVSPQARGSGTARDLLSHAEHLLSEQGVAEAELFCTAGNVRAQRFYAREGWRLSRSFEDALWLPDNVAGRFTVETHCYRKHLGFR